MKKGQITLFIVLAVVIVLVIAVAFYYRHAILEEEKVKAILPIEVKEIKEDIEECIGDIGLNSIYFIGFQGGYFIPPIRSLKIDGDFFPYYYYEGKNTMPPLSEIENEISLCVKTLLPNCLNIESDGFKFIYPKSTNIKTAIKDEFVNVEIEFPVTIIKDEIEFKLDEPYSKTYPIKLGQIYSTAEEIVDRTMQGDYVIDLEYLSNQRFNVTILMHKDKSLLYTLDDPESTVDDMVYTFMFANKFK